MAVKIYKSDGTWSQVDGMSFTMQEIYDAVHPVGETVIGFSTPTVPSNVTATWSLSSSYDGNALWVDSTKTAGTILTGSLPNIEGFINMKASNSNSVYNAAADTNVVRPTSTVVHVYVRTA